MKKQNHLIAYATCVLLLSSIINCQENRRPIVQRRASTFAPSFAESSGEHGKATAGKHNEEIEEENEIAEVTKPLIEDDAKQIKKATPPSTWQMIYALLPQIFVQSFANASLVGVGAITSILTKQLLKKQKFIAEKNQWNSIIEEDAIKRNISYSPQQKLLFLQNAIPSFDQKEQQFSTPVILATTASSAYIFTLAAMTGEILKFGINIALQLMMPNSK